MSIFWRIGKVTQAVPPAIGETSMNRSLRGKVAAIAVGVAMVSAGVIANPTVASAAPIAADSATTAFAVQDVTAADWPAWGVYTSRAACVAEGEWLVSNGIANDYTCFWSTGLLWILYADV